MANTSTFQVTVDFDKFKNALAKEIKIRTIESANLVHAYILRTKLSGERSGRLAKIPGTNRYYRQSLPGQPPATRLGDLRRSLAKSNLSSNRGKHVIHVGTNIDYAVDLERPQNPSRKRPFLESGFRESKDSLVRMWNRKFNV